MVAQVDPQKPGEIRRQVSVFVSSREGHSLMFKGQVNEQGLSDIQDITYQDLVLVLLLYA